MTDGNSERAIGRLEGKLDTLLLTVEKNTEKSEQGRSRIYQELEQARADQAETKNEVKALKAQLAEAAPVIADIKKWRERFVGMMLLVGAVGSFIGGAGVLFWKWVSAKLGI